MNICKRSTNVLFLCLSVLPFWLLSEALSPEEKLINAVQEGRDGNVLQIRKLFHEHPNLNVNAKNKEGETALMVAVDNGKLGAVKELLKHQSQVATKNYAGAFDSNALIASAEANGFDEIAELLKAHSAR